MDSIGTREFGYFSDPVAEGLEARGHVWLLASQFMKLFIISWYGPEVANRTVDEKVNRLFATFRRAGAQIMSFVLQVSRVA
jgi:hypothetical protein